MSKTTNDKQKDDPWKKEGSRLDKMKAKEKQQYPDNYYEINNRTHKKKRNKYPQKNIGKTEKTKQIISKKCKKDKEATAESQKLS